MVETFYLRLSNDQLYPYKIVPSKRSKYIRIKLSQQGDLSVTIPVLTKSRFGHEFIQSKKSWIEKNLAKVKLSTSEELPTKLDLQLLNEEWKIQYSKTEIPKGDNLKVFERDNFILEIQGNDQQINNRKQIAKAINNWCKQKAKIVFNSMLQEIAEVHGFHYHRLSIRAQKTRWGSCSHKKNINLNCKLLFMPTEVVRYVMIHELCHTIEMNHSNRFWSLVQECDPEYRDHKITLKTIGKSIVI